MAHVGCGAATHSHTGAQTAHVATEVSRLYEVTAQSLRETKRVRVPMCPRALFVTPRHLTALYRVRQLHEQSLRRREARTTVELQLQSAQYAPSWSCACAFATCTVTPPLAVCCGSTAVTC